MIELAPAAASHLHPHEIDAVLETIGPGDPVTVAAGSVAICEDTGDLLLHPSDGGAPKIIGTVPSFVPGAPPGENPVTDTYVNRAVTHAATSAVLVRLHALEDAHSAATVAALVRLHALEALEDRIDTLERMAHEHE